jgi:hypothetical protein
LLPNITDITSIWNLFTAVPVLVTAFVCHYNGKLLSQCVLDNKFRQQLDHKFP